MLIICDDPKCDREVDVGAERTWCFTCPYCGNLTTLMPGHDFEDDGAIDLEDVPL